MNKEKLVLKKHTGTKSLLAAPMTRLEYNNYRGWKMPDNEDGSEKGMLVEYLNGGKANDDRHKGYISWSPLDVFNDAYNRTKNMNFGMIIEALRLGSAVARKGWNGKGMFVVKQIPAEIGLDIIPKMQSLPQSAKQMLIENNTPINYQNQMLIIKSDGTADSWVPSSSDIFAEDWQVIL